MLNLPFSSFQLLENLGKADRTTDEVFEENVINFQKQQVGQEVLNILRIL